MDSFLNRYRNITVLLLVIFGQLILIAVQVKNDRDIRMIRVWTVTAVTPAARVIEAVRSGSAGFVRNYILLKNTDAENRRLQAEVNRLKLENVFLKNQLNTADRAKALEVFQSQSPSKTLAASVIAAGAGVNSKVVFVDRGSVSGVQRGMGVITPDGIVGKVLSVYLTSSAVELITDPDFAAGVVSQKNQARGLVKGQGTPLCKMDYVSPSDKLEVGEWLYTSGDDRVFPRGLPVGVVKSVREGSQYKEVTVEPAAMRQGNPEDALIIMDGVHQAVPEQPVTGQPVFVGPPPPGANPPEGSATPVAQTPPPAHGGGTAADQLWNEYKAVGDAQKHVFGAGLPGSKPPDFTKLGQPIPVAPAPAPKTASPSATAPKTVAPSAPTPRAASPATAPKNPPAKAPPPQGGPQPR